MNEAGTVIQGQAATHLLMVHQKEDHPLWVTLGSPSTTMLMVRCQEQMSSMAGDPRENGTKFHHENPMDGGAWWATVHGVAQSQTRLSD